MKVFAILLMMMVCLAGCATTVERHDVEEVIDHSGLWNDTDARLATEELLDDCLSRNWIENFHKDQGRNPTVILGTVLNRSHEHINTHVITTSIQRTLLNSGSVDFVASKQEREEIREERDDQQQGFTDPDTISEHGSEVGADFMLKGSINSIKDPTRGKVVNYYQVNLELIDLRTNQKKWIGQKEIKKLIKRPRFSI